METDVGEQTGQPAYFPSDHLLYCFTFVLVLQTFYYVAYPRLSHA